jgi:hypothetical protein
MKYERAPEYEQQFTRLNTPYASEWPDRRPLKIFALDPLRGKTAGNEVTITIPNENLKRGPASERIKVIDYDGTLNVYYAPVDLDEGPILMRNGLDPSESDPRFHQQMVYAVTMRVLENFERALGRRLTSRGKSNSGSCPTRSAAPTPSSTRPRTRSCSAISRPTRSIPGRTSRGRRCSRAYPTTSSRTR